MNSKLHSFPKKSITFKTATFIVIGAHILAIAGIISWSNYNSSIAKQKRIEDNLKRLARPTSTDWPKPDARPRVVAKPSPTPRKEPTKPGAEVLVSNNATVIKDVLVSNNATVIKDVLVEAAKKTAEAITQTKVTEHLKQEFLKTKKSNTNVVAQEPSRNVIKSTRIVRESNKSPVIESYERRVISSSSNDIIISPQTVKTYVSNGVHYIQLN